MSCSVDISRSEVITMWGTMGEKISEGANLIFINLCIYIFPKLI